MRTKRGRWFWALVTALTLASVTPPTLAEQEQPSEDKVAVVNGSVITRTDFDEEMDRVRQQFSNRGRPITDSQLSEIKKGILENLIDRELLYQESQRKGIEVDEAAINRQLKTLEKQLKQKMAIEQFIDEEFGVSEEEIKAYYDSNPNLFKQPEQVRASHILINVDPQADESQKAEARKKLEAVRQRLEENEDFAALAKEFSQGPSGPKGGDLGYFRRGQMVKPFEEAAFALAPDEVSDIVETRFGYHLIKVIEKKPETTVTYKEAKDSLKQYLKRQKAQKEVSAYLKKLRDEAKIQSFLEQESE